MPDNPTPVSTPLAKEILLRGYEKPVGYACPTCMQLFLLTEEDHRDDKRKNEVEAQARLHCYRFCLVCNKPLLSSYSLRCPVCLNAREEEREEARFQAALKVSIEDYPDQPVFWTNHRDNGFFENIDAVLDYCENKDLAPPQFVWGALPTDLHLDAESVVHAAIEEQEHHEDAESSIPHQAMKNLQAYLNVWAEEQKIRSWHADYRRAVLLSHEDNA